jgi:hypothetical protein
VPQAQWGRGNKMKTPEEIARLRTELVGHLLTALAIAIETGYSAVNYLIELAIDKIRSSIRPA